MNNVKALVGTFNQEKALVAAVIVKSSRTFVESSTVEADIRNIGTCTYLGSCVQNIHVYVLVHICCVVGDVDARRRLARLLCWEAQLIRN